MATQPADNAALFEQVTRLDTLEAAWARVLRNSGAAGGDGVTVGAFAAAAPSRLLDLHRALRSGGYRPGPLRRLSIPKTDGSSRPLAIPCVIDRVAQTATALVLTPVLDPEMEDASFGYRPGRSVQQAVARVALWRDRGYQWVIDADIERYFEQVPHDRLIDRLERSIGPGLLTELIAVWLETGSDNGIGLAQGSPLSPLLSNLYLDEVDEALAERGVRLVRFADDFVVLCRSQDRAERLLDHVATILTGHGLRLNREKTRIVPFDQGFHFLGHLFVRSMVLQSPKAEQQDDTEALLRLIASRDAEALAAAAEAEEQARSARAAGLDAALRTLYVLNRGRRLALRNEAFTVVENDGAGGQRELIAIHHRHLDRIDIGPEADAEAEAVRWALATDTELAFVTGHGETHGRLVRADARRARLHLDQARHILDDGLRLDLARRIVDGRIRNQRALLRRLNRQRKHELADSAVQAINTILRRLDTAGDVAALLGWEGQAAARYWPALGSQIEGGWNFDTRQRRPPDDPVNAVISYLCGLLERDVAAMLARHGLHPGFGVLHSPQDRHDACVYDLMEEFRAPLVEGLAVYLFNRRMLRADQFGTLDNGVCRIGSDAIGAVIRGYEHWVDRPIASPRSGKRTSWRGLISDQALALSAHFQGREPYRPYVMDY